MSPFNQAASHFFKFSPITLGQMGVSALSYCLCRSDSIALVELWQLSQVYQSCTALLEIVAKYCHFAGQVASRLLHVELAPIYQREFKCHISCAGSWRRQYLVTQIGGPAREAPVLRKPRSPGGLWKIGTSIWHPIPWQIGTSIREQKARKRGEGEGCRGPLWWLWNQVPEEGTPVTGSFPCAIAW